MKTITSTHLVSVLLPLWTLLAYPMYKLVAFQCSGVRVYAIFSIALMIPLLQQGVFHCLKRWLLRVLPATAVWASTINLVNLFAYRSLPLMFAVWTLPVSPGAAAGKCLLRCAGILVVVPISCYCGCFGGKRVVLAQLPALTIWAVSAACPVVNRTRPDMRAACWAVGT